jgi:hypothetical protein
MSPAGYLIQYGQPAFVGRFTTAGLTADRGERVVVRTPRGVELGEVLCEADRRFGGDLEPAGGDLLRIATPEDLADAERRSTVAKDLLVAAVAGADSAGLSLSVLDVELLLDGTGAILHVLPWADCDYEQFLAELSTRFRVPVRVLDLTRTAVAVDPVEPTHTCGKPDCGSGSCTSCGSGCSTGGCSRGSVKSSDDLTAYFADLRARMDAQAARTPLH